MRIALVLALIAVICAALVTRENARGAELLTNGSFENGTTGWDWLDGSSLETVSSPVKVGGAAGRFAGLSQPSSQPVYQFVTVAPGETYEFSGWVLHNDPAVDRVFLRILWFDQFGSLVIFEDSEHLTGQSPDFRPLTIGPDNAPAAARSARVEVRVLTNGDFVVYLDALSLQGPDPTPPPTPSPPPTTQSPGPPTSPSPTAPTLPPTTTATPVPHATPTPGATASPQDATPTPEPRVFAQLINGGFEVRRSDGTPVGWHKFGGEMRTTGAPRTEGDVALAFSSTTGSTKWVYQAVNVDPGVHYEASAYTMPQARSSETFLRVSWYASEDGSGSAIGSDDSTASVSGSASAFSLLSTGPVQAPAGSRSARIRLMLRPGTEAPVTAYFDAVSFGRSGPLAGGSGDGGGQQGAAGPTVSGGAASGTSTTEASATATTAEPGATALSASRTPVGLANVTPGSEVNDRPESGGGGDSYDWAIIAFGVATPVVGFGLIAAQELRRLRRRD